MKEDESNGFWPKVFSVIVIQAMVFLIPFAGGVVFLVKAIPVFIIPFYLIWYPDNAREYFSSQVTQSVIRKWGVAGIVIFFIPLMIALVAFK